jgi:hypothetical protein
MRQNIKLLIFVFPLLSCSLFSQSLSEKYVWEDIPCIDLIFTMEYPKMYIAYDHCHTFCKDFERQDCRINIDLEIDNFKKEKYIKKTLAIKNFKDWIEWRTRIHYDADGCDGSTSGDSIYKDISFTNSVGTIGNKIYIYVNTIRLLNGERSKQTSIKGPVFVFKKNQELNLNEPVFFIHAIGEKTDSLDIQNMERMADTFKYK